MSASLLLTAEQQAINLLLDVRARVFCHWRDAGWALGEEAAGWTLLCHAINYLQVSRAEEFLAQRDVAMAGGLA